MSARAARIMGPASTPRIPATASCCLRVFWLKAYTVWICSMMPSLAAMDVGSWLSMAREAPRARPSRAVWSRKAAPSPVAVNRCASGIMTNLRIPRRAGSFMPEAIHDRAPRTRAADTRCMTVHSGAGVPAGGRSSLGNWRRLIPAVASSAASVRRPTIMRPTLSPE